MQALRGLLVARHHLQVTVSLFEHVFRLVLETLRIGFSLWSVMIPRDIGRTQQLCRDTVSGITCSFSFFGTSFLTWGGLPAPPAGGALPFPLCEGGAARGQAPGVGFRV